MIKKRIEYYCYRILKHHLTFSFVLANFTCRTLSFIAGTHSKLEIMNKTYIVSMFISATLLLILKLTDLKEISTLIVLEISFYSIIIILMIYNYLKLYIISKKGN